MEYKMKVIEAPKLPFGKMNVLTNRPELKAKFIVTVKPSKRKRVKIKVYEEINVGDIVCTEIGQMVEVLKIN